MTLFVEIQLLFFDIWHDTEETGSWEESKTIDDTHKIMATFLSTRQTENIN